MPWSAPPLLGRQGQNVCSSLERNDRIGGCIRTDEITAPGYVHDVMATTFVLFITSPAYAALAADLGRHGLEFCQHRGIRPACCCPDGSVHLIQQHGACRRTAPRFAQFSAARRRRAACSPTSAVSSATPAFALRHCSAVGLWTWPTGEAPRRQKRGGAARVGLASVPRRGASPRRAPGSRRTSYQSDARPRAVGAVGAACRPRAGGAPIPAQIAKVIAFALEAAGAPDRQGRRARSCLTAFSGADPGDVAAKSAPAPTSPRYVAGSGGAARTVQLADGSGETITAKKSVICSVTPTQLYERLLGRAAPEAARPRG
jgi:hypothetical protein